MRSTILLAGLFLAPTLHAADAPNWPHWRGPDANGSAKGNPPTTWDAKTNVKWKSAIPGKGSSTPVVWGNKVFVLTAVDTGRKADAADTPAADPKFPKKTNAPDTWHQFLVLCFDLRDGKELWRKVAAERVPHEGHHPSHSYAAGSPATDGKRLIVSFGSFGVFAYDLDGKLLWNRDLGRMNTRLGWGEANTPALFGDRVVIDWDHEGASFITALDADTGKTVWKEARDEVTTWATPLIVKHKGVAQVIVPATKKARSYDLATGKVIWECGGFTVNCIPSPVVHGDRVILMSGYKGAMAKAVPLDSKGDVTDKAAWQYTTGTPYVPSPALAGDRLYFTSSYDPILTCLDCRTGKVLIDRARIAGLGQLYASPVVAAGRIYIVGRDGTTAVLEHGETLKRVATNKLDEPIDASPVVVGDRLLLRGERHLYCIAE